MGVFYALFVLFCLASLSYAKKGRSGKAKKASGSASSASSAGDRITTLASKLPLTYLSDKNFTAFVANRPRDYHAVLMFTALDKKYQCQVCGRAKDTFVRAAELYSDQYDFAGESSDRRVAFLIVDVDSARDTFNDMGLETVPRIFALPPLSTESPKVRVGDFEIQSQSLLEGPSAFLDSVKESTGISVVVTQDPWSYILIMGVLAYLLAFVASAASFTPAEALYWYRSSSLWVVVSSLCFIVGVSGSIFCVIRSAPLVGMHHGLTIFAGAGRDQYLLEGIIISLMTLGCGVAGMIMLGATKLRSPEPFTRHILVMLALATFIALGTEIAQLYQMKTGWYQFKDTLPPEAWAWITGSVKKSTGLWKRLFRLSEVYLYEFTSFTGFKKKAKTILFDYLGRVYLGITPKK